MSEVPKEEEGKAKVRVQVWTVDDFQDIKVQTGTSSIAGASSGEFHLFNKRSRAESDRVKQLVTNASERKEKDEWEKRQDERRMQDEERTAKKRAKRQKRKGGNKGKKKDASAVPSGHAGGETGSEERVETDAHGAVVKSLPGGAPTGGVTLHSRGNLVGAGPIELGNGVEMEWWSLSEGSSSGEGWQLDAERSQCVLITEGYLTHRFRDVAGDVREAMSTRAGDYALLSSRQPHHWEAMSNVAALVVRATTVVADSIKPSYAHGNAPGHEGTLWAGEASLAPAGTTRKLFAAGMGWAGLSAGGTGRGVPGCTVVLLRGKTSVTVGRGMAVLANTGDWVQAPIGSDVSWTGLEAGTLLATVARKK